MQPTTLTSLAIMVTAAAFISTADAHGQMLIPEYRKITAKFKKDGGTLSQAGDQELQYSPVELLSQRKQKDFPEAATFSVMNGCRGTVYESGNDVTTLEAGAEFDVKWIIQAPHPGTMKLSIVKPSTGSSGKIMYENYKTILTVDSFAQNAGEDGTTAKMPSDVEGCGSAGDCALQFYWHSDIANQTYPTCADIIVSGSGTGTGTATTPSTSTTSTAASTESSSAGSPTSTTSDTGNNETPSTNSSPSTSTTTRRTTAPSTQEDTPSSASTPSSESTPSTETTPSSETTNGGGNTATTAPSSNTYSTESSVAGEADSTKCTRRMRK
ncbi:hypothetical protein PHYBOEH_006942 [Phytophthora boehmeriae]|uniref:Chitin-binding type-4 domain-containing protein n=1 Tax=Phytophthora boehmeriae TaxID=109152 RepID=A0A8T1WEG5_9STRA|nr:hypothetical protein PHYBOEH_006942 [Phytophthora boehmeriae]